MMMDWQVRQFLQIEVIRLFMWKKLALTMGAAFLLQAPVSGAFAATLASVQADVTGDSAVETVELQGDKMPGDSNYYQHLLVVVRNAGGDLLGVWNPDLNGGYNCLLRRVPSRKAMEEADRNAEAKDGAARKTDGSEAAPNPARQKGETMMSTRNETDMETLIRERQKAVERSQQSLLEEMQDIMTEEQKAFLKDMMKDRKEFQERMDAMDKEMVRLNEESQKAVDGLFAREQKQSRAKDDGYDRILLLAGRGGSEGAVDGRLLNFTQPKKAVVEFTGVDSLGITADAAYLPDYRYRVAVKIPGRAVTSALEFTGRAENVLGVYGEDGGIARPYLHPHVTSVTSLSAWLGQLFTTQDVLAADKKSVLGTLRVRWSGGEDGSWTPVDVSWQPGSRGKKDTEAALVQTAAAGDWRLYPQTAWVGERVIQWPVVSVSGSPEIQNRVNDALDGWLHEGRADGERAYQVKYAGKNLLCIEAGRRLPDDGVARRIFNFDMRTGAEVSLADAFTVRNPDFRKIINLTGKPKNAFEKAEPAYWFREGSQVVFADRILEAGFQDEEAVHRASVDQENLDNFVKDASLFAS